MARRRGEFTTGKQRILLEDKLAELEERRRKLERMSEFLRSKLSDLRASD